jgi:hypothetical protein
VLCEFFWHSACFIIKDSNLIFSIDRFSKGGSMSKDNGKQKGSDPIERGVNPWADPIVPEHKNGLTEVDESAPDPAGFYL